MVNINENLITDTQNLKRKKLRQSTAEKSSNHKDNKKGRKKQGTTEQWENIEQNDNNKSSLCINT